MGMGAGTGIAAVCLWACRIRLVPASGTCRTRAAAGACCVLRRFVPDGSTTTPQPLLLDFGLRPVSCALRVHTVICSAKAGEAGVCVSRPPCEMSL